MSLTLPLVFLISLASVGFAYWLAQDVLKRDTGTPEMQEVSNAIKQGAEAFLRTQNMAIAVLAIFVGAGLYALYASRGEYEMAKITCIAFFLGAFCSALAGFIGMFIAIRSNIRTAAAARTSTFEALTVALRGGAVSGIIVVALSLIGVLGLFVSLGGASGSEEIIKKIPFQIVGFGFGASFVALFAQLGGGIFTKAADVGADLVGKVEAGIPEDDPRNPAVIADLVGDNVGDCAGRGADLFESTAAENIGAMILGVAMYPVFGMGGIMFPLVARSFGLLACIVGVMNAKAAEEEDPMNALNRGYIITSVLAMVGFLIADIMLLKANMWLFGAGVVGIVTSFLFVLITQYYTEYKYQPVKDIAEACKTGPATTIITGLAVAMECTTLPVFIISIALFLAYQCGLKAMVSSPIPIPDFNAGLYGTAIATMGMLAPCAYVLAMDTFGPITDNAGGIVEFSKQPDEVRHKTDRLDAVGNTTKALTKGYAIGSAALAAFLLFTAYMDEVTMMVRHKTGDMTYQFHAVNIAKIEIFIGGLLGAMLVFLFSGWAIRAVGNAAQYVIQNVRDQFKEKPGIMDGTEKPDYSACVAIVTKGALYQMIKPGLLVVAMPISVGIIFKYLTGSGAEAVAAFLMVGTIAGILVATMLNNGGGAWDNAKKLIELDPAWGGKGSETHKAAVVGDTVGDPLKDTAGPSIHVLIKLLSTVTLVLAPMFI